MLAANYSTVRTRFKEYLDQAANGETVIVTRKNQNHCVIINMEEYSAMAKARRNEEYLAKIDQARARLDAGLGVNMNMEEFNYLLEKNGIHSDDAEDEGEWE